MTLLVFESSFAPVLATFETPQADLLTQMIDSPLPLSPTAAASPVKARLNMDKIARERDDYDNETQQLTTPLSPTRSIPFSAFGIPGEPTTPGGVPVGEPISPRPTGTLSRWPSRLSGFSVFGDRSKDKSNGKSKQDTKMDGKKLAIDTLSSRPSIDGLLKSPALSLAVPGDGKSPQESRSKVGKRLSFLGLDSKR